MKKRLLMLFVVLVSLFSIFVFGEIILLSGSNQNTFINSYLFLLHEDTTVNFGQNWTCRANVTDFENDRVVFVNFTLESPSGYRYIDSENGTQFGDYWNSSIFTINETGTWKWNITSNDNISINTSLPYTSGTFIITDDLDWTPNKIEATTNITTDKIYNIEFWTDSRENLNFTIHHNINANFTVTLNVSYLVINDTRGVSYLNLNISPNSSTVYGNHSANLTVTRKDPLNRTWKIPIEIEVTSNFGDIEFVSPSDYIVATICPGTWTHTADVTNNGNFDMTNCHPYLYDTNGTEVSSSTNFNLAGGASSKANVTYLFTDDIITHFGVYCTASANGSLDYTSNDPKITLIEGADCREAGGGPGGGAAPPMIKVVEEAPLPEPPRFCGDGTCDDDLGETPWSCSKDCLTPAIDFKKIFCMPLFRCGNWEKAWFINLIVLIIAGYFVYFMVFKKKERL